MSYDIDLMKIFTACEKDFLSVDDLKEMTGLADTRCIKLLRDIKGVSDVFGLQGRIHRVDYYKYIRYMESLSRRGDFDYDVALADIFTTSDRDFFAVKDLEEMTGLAETRCIKLLRDIKEVSDIFGLKGRIHRVDYYKYIRCKSSRIRRDAPSYKTRPYTKRKKAE